MNLTPVPGWELGAGESLGSCREGQDAGQGVAGGRGPGISAAFQPSRPRDAAAGSDHGAAPTAARGVPAPRPAPPCGRRRGRGGAAAGRGKGRIRPAGSAVLMAAESGTGAAERRELSPRSQQQMQERTPPPPAAPPPAPLPAPRRSPQLRVLLTPLPAPGRRLPQKRLLGAYDEAAGGDEKRRRAEPCDPERADGGSDGDADSDGTELGQDGSPQLSAYERKRLKNISENAKFFAALKLHESAARLHQMAAKGPSHVTKRAKPKKAEGSTVQRRSMRLQRMQPPEVPQVEAPAQEEEEYPQVPAGPLPMAVDGQEESSDTALLGTWLRLSEMNSNDTEKPTCDMKRYQAALSSMLLREDGIRKVVSSRVCSVAIHPSESTVLVAAGDKYGHVGLWDASCTTEGGALVFTPHNFSVNCMRFSPSHPAQLLSLSHDSLRCGDVSRAVFDEICRSEDSLSSFDFLEDGACTAVVGLWGGTVAVVDRRTPGTSPELSADIGFKVTRTVDVHPVDKQYFLAAGSVDVRVYDVRWLRRSGNKAVSTLHGHTKSVASAYFSPISGHRVVTVCADDKLRVYDTSSLSATSALLSTVRHNNNTGRWLTRFRAVWDPKQEQCFVVGSMARPRQIEVFQDTGVLLHAFCSPECLGSVCSINAFHPTRNVLVGGNSSGRLHVFME
ncbi:WD repeat-containing protein 76 [Tympanuchus pallidicinctus]|uniref:WD repeat-containing protein 76 n=1 Tax=Tympanuchus pallidicinctus TaxID=109042 RepID=UPI0022870819|nr:WD repeat-containing protein 76 [Tympanuchus pallidicinctus]